MQPLDPTRAAPEAPTTEPVGPWGTLAATSNTCDAFEEENERLREANARLSVEGLGPWGSLETTTLTCDALAEQNGVLQSRCSALDDEVTKLRSVLEAERNARREVEQRLAKWEKPSTFLPPSRAVPARLVQHDYSSIVDEARRATWNVESMLQQTAEARAVRDELERVRRDREQLLGWGANALGYDPLRSPLDRDVGFRSLLDGHGGSA